MRKCNINCSGCRHCGNRASFSNRLRKKFREKNGGITVQLPFEEHEQMHEHFSAAAKNPIYGRQELLNAMVTGLQGINKYMPEYILRKLLAMKLGEITPSYYLLKGMPIDYYLPHTPNNGAWQQQKETFIAEHSLLALASILGNPFGFKKEKDGRIFNQIAAIPGMEKANSSASSNSTLGFHSEIAYHELLRPRFIILLCLRQDREKTAATTVVDMRRVIANLPEWVVTELRKAQFQFKVPDSFTNSTVWAPAKPIIRGSLDNPEIVYDAKACKTVFPDTPGEEALKILEAEINQPEHLVKIYLEPGDALVLPNFYVLHGRSDYQPRYDGLDRWLVRVYVASDNAYYVRENMSQSLLVFNK